MLTTVSTTVQLILAGVVGLLIGLLISSLLNREPKSALENTLPKDLTQEGYSEAARLLYSPSTKRVVTQLDGDFYKEFLPLTPEQRRRVLRLLQAWKEWCEQSSAQNEPAKQPLAVTQTPVENSDQRPETIYKPLADPIRIDQDLESAPKTENLADLGIKIPEEVQPIPAVISIGSKPVKIEKKEPLTIVEQINEVINKLAAGTPIEKRNIRLAEKGHEGITVWVGLDHFDGVDAVPFPEVQQLIKAAVARWEEETEVRMKNAEKI